MKRELKRRSAIEPMIGHAKNDGRLGRNWLLGADGDKINALLAAAGHNLRFVLRKLALCFVRFLGTQPGILPPEARIWASTAADRRFRILGSGQRRPPHQWLRLFSGRTSYPPVWARSGPGLGEGFFRISDCAQAANES